MRAAADIVHLLTLDMHAADEHRFRPFEILRRRGADVFVDEADRPVRRQISRDQQQTLRRHEGLDAVGQGIGVLERSKRRCIARKNAQDAPCRFNTLSSHQISSKSSGKGNIAQIKHDPQGRAKAELQIPQHCDSRSNAGVTGWLRASVRNPTFAPPCRVSRGGGLFGSLRRSIGTQNRAAPRCCRRAETRRRLTQRETANRRIPAPASGRTDRGYKVRRGTKWTGSST